MHFETFAVWNQYHSTTWHHRCRELTVKFDWNAKQVMTSFSFGAIGIRWWNNSNCNTDPTPCGAATGIILGIQTSVHPHPISGHPLWTRRARKVVRNTCGRRNKPRRISPVARSGTALGLVWVEGYAASPVKKRRAESLSGNRRTGTTRLLLGAIGADDLISRAENPGSEDDTSILRWVSSPCHGRVRFVLHFFLYRRHCLPARA